MGFDWKAFFRRHRIRIIEEWSFRLRTEISRHYARRPREELLGTVAQAFDANYHAITNGDYGRINRFIGDISRMRLAGGFALNDVLKAFELFRRIVVPILHEETSYEDFYSCVLQVNECVAYTVDCFSNLFQELHNQYLMDYTKRLEADVRARTSELLESELKYKTLIEEINDGYVVIQDEVIVFVNPAFCEMHGFALGELLGKRFDQLVDPRDRGMVARMYDGGDQKENRFPPLEYYRLTRDGDSLPTEITVKSTCYGNQRSTIGICRDITERVLMEAKVREAERMAYIGRITTSLSHEIRNPLSAVKMNLQILEKKLNLQGNDRRRLEISAREVHRLEGILEELLDFAKPLTLKRSPCNLNRILPACLELLEGKFEEKHLSVCLSLDPAMPDISADVHKLEQAVVNLLLNAIEGSNPRGRIWIGSSCCNDADPPRVGFSIANEAVIDDDVLSEIFKPFFTTKPKGTGLGLTNVKRIAEAHGGTVFVESGDEDRTVFSVLLPVGGSHG